MKALAIDCSVSRLAVAAKNETSEAKIVLDIGIKQSEKLLPSIDFVLRELALKPSDLDYVAVTLGPGSFTGLRLGLSTAKALSLAFSIPLYGIPSLEALAFPYKRIGIKVLPVIEAKENEFFCALYENGTELLPASDLYIEDIFQKLPANEDILVTGHGRKQFLDYAHKTAKADFRLKDIVVEADSTESLFSLAEAKKEKGEACLTDFEGPLYIRKSEAEIVLQKKMHEADMCSR